MVVVALIAPWYLLAREMLLGHRVGWMAPINPVEWLGHLVTTYVTGVALRWPWPLVFAAPALLVGIAGTLALARRRTSTGWLILSATLVPLPLAYVASLGRPLFLERHLAYASPFVLLVCVVGVVSVARTRIVPRVAAGCVLAAGMLGGLWGTYFDASFAKAANWRGAAAVVQAGWQDGDVAIANSPDPAFQHYLRRALPAGATIVLLPDSSPPDRSRTEAALTALALQPRSIWHAPVRDPSWDADGMVERWLDTYTFPLIDDRSAGPQVRRFVTAAAMLKRWPRPAPVVFDGRIALLGADLSSDGSPGSPEPMVVRPDDEIWLTLYFEPSRRLPLDYRVFNHLVGPDGRVYGQHDGAPLDGKHTTLAWAPGELLMDRHRIRIDSNAPAGSYQIRVGFYDPATGARLPVVSSTGALLGDFAAVNGVTVAR